MGRLAERRRALASLVVVALVGASCAACTGDGDDGGGDSPFTSAELLYGLAPPRQADGMEYQDDVVIVGDGAESVRSLSPDGLTWTIAGDAEGMDDLEVGEVMFVTGRAVGRVLHIEDAGDDREVVLGPVELTEIYRELDLEIDQPVDLGAMPLLQAPDMPGVTESLRPEGEPSGDPEGEPSEPVEEEPSPDGTGPGAGSGEDEVGAGPGGRVVELPPVHLVASPAPAAVAGRPADLRIENMDVKKYASRDGIGLGFQHNASGVKLNGYLFLSLTRPTLEGHIKIRDGGIDASIELKGAAGVRLHLDAGSSVGLDHNLNDVYHVPASISLPVAGLAAPVSIGFSQRFIVKTAFSAKNSTFSATGAYDVNGSLRVGFEGGEFEASAPGGFNVRESLLDNIDGISVGVNGFVLAHAARVTVGLGMFGFTVGPYAEFRSAYGMTNGSDLGLVKCKGASLDFWISGGVGYQIPGPIADAINGVLEILNVATRIQPVGGAELGVQSVLHREGLTPDVKICRG